MFIMEIASPILYLPVVFDHRVNWGEAATSCILTPCQRELLSWTSNLHIVSFQVEIITHCNIDSSFDDRTDRIGDSHLKINVFRKTDSVGLRTHRDRISGSQSWMNPECRGEQTTYATKKSGKKNS